MSAWLYGLVMWVVAASMMYTNLKGATRHWYFAIGGLFCLGPIIVFTAGDPRLHVVGVIALLVVAILLVADFRYARMKR